MKRYLLLTAMCIGMVLSASGQTSVWDGSHTTWTNGNGTQANPYLIENAAQFAHLAYVVNNGIGAGSGHIVGTNTYYKLMMNIDLNGSETFQWTPVGYYISEADYYAFGGNFDGNGKTIANLFINTTTLQRIGLFGYTDGASIKNLGIVGSSSVIRASASLVAYAGGIVGYSNNTNFDNCHNTGNVSGNVSTNTYSVCSYSGGIVGYISGIIIISNCYNIGNVSSTATAYYTHCSSYAGGIIGYYDYGYNNNTINNCYNTGNIFATVTVYYYSSYDNVSSYAGGIIGYGNYGYDYNNNNTINNCYSIGNISAIATSNSSHKPSSYAGGIFGVANGTIAINNCYNKGNISAIATYSSFPSFSLSGGIVGYGSGTRINNCYNEGTITDGYYQGGIVCYGISSIIINNCYNVGTMTGVVAGGTSQGGILGYNNDYCSATINNCYNVGTMTGCNYIGGIVGYRQNSNVQVNNSYYLITCGGNNTYGGQSRTEVFMKDAEFVRTLNNEQAFVYKRDITPYINIGYPVLTKGFEMQLRPVANITQASATLKCLLRVGDVTITIKQLVCNNQTINLTSTDTLLTHTVSGLMPNTAYSYTFRAVNNQNDTCKLAGTFTTLPITTTTQDATSITQTKAILNGEVVFGDATVTKGFEYKLSTEANYTSVNVSGNNSNITSNLTGLMPNKTYQFRTFCTYGDNTIYGTVNSFTTLAVTVTTLPATDITRSTATFNGTSNFGDATVIKQGFVLGNDTLAVSNTATTLTYNVTDLAKSTAFSYKTFCRTADGTVYGTVQNFTTLAFNTDNSSAFLIETKEDLILLANLVKSGNTFSGQTFILANDITLPVTPNNILSIGDKNTNRPFSGTFHGNGKRIYNVYIDEPNTPYQGFFGYTKNAHLYEVGLVDITASGRNYTGGMVGYAENTRINDSYVSGGTLFALSYCGGLVGYQTQGTNSIISGCYNTCEVSGNNYVGGLLGYSNQGTVRNCYAAALVTGNGNGVGAIIGGAQDVLSYNCYFNENLTGQPYAIGENNISQPAPQRAPAENAAGEEGNMSSNEMRMQSFVNTLNQGLTIPVWKMDYATPINNGFPILIWQSPQGENSIETTKTGLELTIYPNPTKEQLIIKNEELKIENYSIFNVSGQILIQGALSTENTTINVKELPSGMYFIKVGNKTGKFIKE